jgi:alcohol dehydrogenase class IV
MLKHNLLPFLRPLMPRNFQFQLPTRIEFGRGGRRKLGTLAREFGRSALLVGYRDRTGLEEAYRRAEGALRSEGMAVSTFFEVTPEPTAESIVAGASAAGEAAADVIVALGGGSVIDAAKGIAVLARLGGSVWDYASVNPQSRPITAALPVVAVPTTAGTGSEVTAVAVFTHQTDVGRIANPSGNEAGLPDGLAIRPTGKPVPILSPCLKVSFLGPALYPKVALIDPDLALGSPPQITAACGADALGHAIEACLSRRANPFSTALAGQAAALIVGNLARAVKEPAAPAPREALALAAAMAGAALNEAGVVVNHAIAHALGALLGVPHGLAVAIGTPPQLRFNAEVAVAPLAELAGCCGLSGDTEADRAQRFVETVVSLLRAIGLPDRVEIPPDAPGDLIDRLARNAMESSSSSITCNPRKVDEPALKDLFRELIGR